MSKLIRKGTRVKTSKGSCIYEVVKDTMVSSKEDVIEIRTIHSRGKYYKPVGGIVYESNKMCIFDNKPVVTEKGKKKSTIGKNDVVRVIYNPPATVVYFGNGTKEVVKVKHGEVFDYTTGVHLCVMKRLLGKDQYNISKKHLYDAIHVARTEMVSKDVNKVVKKIKIAFGFIKEKSAPLPKFAEGDVVECIKDTFNFKKHDTTIIIQLGIQYEGGVSYMTSRPNEHYKNADVYWGINYKDQNKFKKIAEKAKS